MSIRALHKDSEFLPYPMKENKREKVVLKSMTITLQKIIDTALNDADVEIHRAACESDGDISEILRKLVEFVERRYMIPRRANTHARPETLARYEAEFQEARTILDKSVRESFNRYRKDRTIAVLEYPLLRVKVEEELRKRKIPFLFETRMDRNILTVHIINEYFFEIPLSLENADRRLGLVGYFIHRPEYAHEELPEIRKKWSRQLYQHWDTLTRGRQE